MMTDYGHVWRDVKRKAVCHSPPSLSAPPRSHGGSSGVCSQEPESGVRVGRVKIFVLCQTWSLAEFIFMKVETRRQNKHGPRQYIITLERGVHILFTFVYSLTF